MIHPALRIAQMSMPGIEKTVQNYDGDGYLKGHPQVFLKNRDDSQADRTHDEALSEVRNLESIVDKRKPDVERA